MNMVRIMVGNIDKIARGEEPLSWLEGLLAGAERVLSGVTAPAEGLFFWRAAYNGDIFQTGTSREPEKQTAAEQVLPL
jgi:tRNA pseudouridine38-40 synthase